MSKSTYILAAAALMTIGSVIPAFGRDGKSASLRAKLSGFNEVIPAGGAVFSDGSGRFRGRDRRGPTEYWLRADLSSGGNRGNGGYSVRQSGPPPLRPATHDRRHHRLAVRLSRQPKSRLPPRRPARVRAALSRGPSSPLMS